MPEKQRQDSQELPAFLSLPGASGSEVWPSLISPAASEQSHSLHPPHGHTCALRAYLELSGIFHAGGAASQGSSQHIPAWPRERRACSPERPGCSPVGERLGQSQFLCWALDGTDGRRFQGSPGWAGATGAALAQGGLLPWGMSCQQHHHPIGYPLHGVSPPRGIPSTRWPRCQCPAAPLTSRPVLQGSWIAQQGLWYLCPCLLAMVCYSSPSSGSLNIPGSKSSPIFGSNCQKEGRNPSWGALFHFTVRLILGHQPPGQ